MNKVLDFDAKKKQKDEARESADNRIKAIAEFMMEDIRDVINMEPQLIVVATIVVSDSEGNEYTITKVNTGGANDNS